jgi:DNA (cytosine-5)-methyltransferase 1
MLNFLSICSGIEAASVAFAPLGWEALAFAEIEPFPCAVLAYHYPHVPNLGDLTQWRTWPAALLVQLQLLCGGTPCQAFSVAGLRASLADARGNLSLIFCELYAHINQLRHAAGLPPALLLWENVPGVLSTHDNAFGCFLAGIAGEVNALQPPGGKWAHAGYVSGPSASIAYRTLDAQYFGLAQRRKRVFVVASADPTFDPSTVLFEFTGLRRDTPPRRETGQTTAPTLSARAKGGGGLGTDAECDGACIPEIAQSQAHTAAETGAGFWTDDGLARRRVTTAPTQPQNIVADLAGTLNANGKAAGSATSQNAKQNLLIPHLANCLTRRMDKGPNTTLEEGQTLLVDVTHSLRAEGFDASEDGTPLVPVPSSVVPPSGGLVESPIPFAFAFQPRIARNGRGNTGDLVNALQAQSGQTGKGDAAPCVAYTLHGTREVVTPPMPQKPIREGTGSAIQNSSNKFWLGHVCS